MTELLVLSAENLSVYGSYIFSFLLFYVSIACIFYLVKSSEIKLMRIYRAPKTSAARNRKRIDDAIALAEKDKKMIFLWPIKLLKGLAAHAKKKITKKEE